MENKSVKITKHDIIKVNIIQKHLNEKGIKLSQRKLLGKIVEYSSAKREDFFEFLVFIS